MVKIMKEDYQRDAENFGLENLEDRMFFADTSEGFREVGSLYEAWELEDKDPTVVYMNVQEATAHLVKCGCTGFNYHNSDRPYTQLAVSVVRNPVVLAKYGRFFDRVYTGIREFPLEGRKLIFATLDYSVAKYYGDPIELENVFGIPFISKAESVIEGVIEGDLEIILPTLLGTRCESLGTGVKGIKSTGSWINQDP